MIQQLKKARQVAVPLVAITTADQPGSAVRIVRGLNGRAAVLRWDLIRGLGPANEPGQQVLQEILGDQDPSVTTNPAEMLALLEKKAQADTVILMENAQRVLGNEAVAQAVGNLREAFKRDGRMLILLAPSLTIPEQLQQDLLVIDDPLPDQGQLQEILSEQVEAAGLEVEEALHDRTVSALRGLSTFAAEQAVALALTKEGLDLPALWQRKVTMIEQTPGLSVWRGEETFAQIGGCTQIKGFLKNILTGRARPQAIVFIDEIEKALAGTTGDTTGVSQALLGALLTYMQDAQATGVVFIGPPGCSKSLVAKASGSEGQIPSMVLDVSAVKGSLVGESERQFRTALKVISAVADGQSLWIATCNKIAVLPPELRRRFTLGSVYFDLPDEAERSAIWTIYRRKYEIPEADTTPDDDGWTGAEIRQCADLAWRLGMSLRDAAAYVVPVSKAAADQIEDLRRQASGRFLSASYPGVYRRGKNGVGGTVSEDVEAEGQDLGRWGQNEGAPLMPCWMRQTVTVDLQVSIQNETILRAALNRLGWPHQQQGQVLTIETPQGTATLAGGTLTVPQGAEELKHQLQKAYATETVKAVSQRFGWKLTSIGQDQFNLTKRRM